MQSGPPRDAQQLATASFSADSILAYVSDSGLTYFDINGMSEESPTPIVDTLVHVTIPELRQQLVHKRGPVFEGFSYLAYQSAQPYSRRTWCPLADGVVVSVRGYDLTFRKENGLLRLVRLDFGSLESE